MAPTDTRKLALIGGALLLSMSARAEGPRFDDTIRFSIGGMEHKGSGSIASTRDNLPVDRLTFADLGLGDDNGIGWARLAWQYAESWQLSLTYSGFDASGASMAVEPGNFDATGWNVGAILTSNLDLELFIVDLSWDFLTTEKGHAGVGAGIHAADFEFDLLIEAFGTIGGESSGVPVVVGREDASVLAPLPNLSLGGGYRLADDLYFDANVGWLSLSYDRYDGRLFSARGAVEWRVGENVGLGVAYQHVDIDVEVEGSSSVERYDLDFYGPILFVSIGF